MSCKKSVAPSMFYVATKALAEAMATGRPCNRGTVYGIFASRAKAEAFRAERRLMFVSAIVQL